MNPGRLPRSENIGGVDATAPNTFNLRGYTVDRAGLWRDGSRLLGPSRPLAVLLYLKQRQGKPIPREELLAECWPSGSALELSDHNVTVAVAKLRALLGAEAILTVTGIGYMLATDTASDSAPEVTERPAQNDGERLRSVPGETPLPETLRVLNAAVMDINNIVSTLNLATAESALSSRDPGSRNVSVSVDVSHPAPGTTRVAVSVRLETTLN